MGRVISDGAFLEHHHDTQMTEDREKTSRRRDVCKPSNSTCAEGPSPMRATLLLVSEPVPVSPGSVT